MFTVVIAEKEHLDSIQTYSVFLKPFLGQKDVVFCEWHPQAETLAESAPGLVGLITGHEAWRALILCDERGLRQKNPFDVIRVQSPERLEGEPDESYAQREQEAVFQAYEAAAREPLVRLTTHLCPWPTVEGGINDAEADPDYADYLAKSQKKQALREDITAKQQVKFVLPQEVLCVAKRTCEDPVYTLTTDWTPHIDHQYSRFYDRNLYLDKLRYLVFDILDREHRDYTCDYIRFLYTVLIVANQDIPQSSLLPNRVYRLDCEHDWNALGQLLANYDDKLSATDEALRQEIVRLQNIPREHLSDEDARTLFCADITVPVTISDEFDRKSLYVNHRGPGLATDCPPDEHTRWGVAYDRVKRRLHRMLKLPRRSLKRAVGDMRAMDQLDEDRARMLSEFQVEDVEEFIGNQEREMVGIRTVSLYDTGEYTKRMEEADHEIQRTIRTRMTLRTTIALGVTALVLFLLGFLPAIFANLGSAQSRCIALAVSCVAVALLAAVGVGALFYLRHILVNRLKHFNYVMAGICQDVDNSLTLYSRYLSCACNMMRGYSVLNFLHSSPDPELTKVKILKKHRSDILKRREELREVFGTFLPEGTSDEENSQSTYEYDFSRAVDYTYPIPYDPSMQRRIEFIQEGCSALVPVDFVKRITIRREELYD